MNDCTASDEQWRPVVGWEGWYEVSDLGHVRSMARVVRGSRGCVQHLKSRARTIKPGFGGYLTVVLYRNNKGHGVRVHTLVLEAFIGPRPDDMECCHDNGDPSDARLSNLYWGTHSQNQLDQVRHGRHSETNKVHCPLEHTLAMPNLTRHHALMGHRSCLACARARANEQHHAKKHGRPFDFRAAAHRHYEKIMGHAVT